MVGRLLRGPWGAERYVLERVGDAGTVPGVPAGAYLVADPDRCPVPGALLLVEHAGRRLVRRIEAVDPTTVKMVGVVVGAFIDLVAS